MALIFRSQIDRELTCNEYDNNLRETLKRENHTGVQSASTIYDLYATVNGYDFIQDLIDCCEELREGLEQLREDIFGEDGINGLIGGLRQEILDLIEIIQGDIVDIKADIQAIYDLITQITIRINGIEIDINDLYEDINSIRAELLLKANINSPTFTGVPKVPTPGLGAEGSQIVNVDYINILTTSLNNNISAAVPIGSLFMYGGNSAPINYLFAQGQEVSRTTYAALFSIFGTLYGAGNGSSTFNLPDLRTRVPVGSGTEYNLGATGGEARVVMLRSQMPIHTHGNGSHSHTVVDPGHRHRVFGWLGGSGPADRVLDTLDDPGSAIPGEIEGSRGNGYNGYIDILGGGASALESSHSNISLQQSVIDIQHDGGGESHNNMQPYLVLNYIIKVI